MGKGNVNVKLKSGILPQIFQYQKDYTIVKPTTSRGTFEKRKRLEYICGRYKRTREEH